MPEIGKWQREFLKEKFALQLQVRDRHNFINMSRYSDKNESTFRENYNRPFDFENFNPHLSKKYCSAECAFAPSYIFKS